MIFLCFFLSGFAALLYQIIWTRLAYTHLGIIPPILSVILAVFMLGLGGGAWLAGRWVKARPTWTPPVWLRLYAACEIFCGLWALGMPWLLRWVEVCLYGTSGLASSAYLWQAGLFLIVTLLPPCWAMGMTTPLMMAADAPEHRSPRRFSFLYTANLTGAIFGVLLSAFVLIELKGLVRTLHVGIAMQLLAALLALVLARVRQKATVAPVDVSGVACLPFPKTLALITLFATGFVTLASEILWTRSLMSVLGTSIYAFATILIVYLIATLLGASLYRHRPRREEFTFGHYMLFVGSVCLPALMLDPALAKFPWFLLSSLAPMCGVAGYLTPYWVDRYAQGDPTRAGHAYAVNTIGCVLGPLVAGYVLLPTVGARLGMVSVAVLTIFCVALSLPRARLIRRGFWILWIVPLLVAISRPSLDESIAGVEGRRIIRRDYAATVLSAGEGMRKRLLVNGVGITELTPLTKVMAHLPLVFLDHPPVRVLVICFGMGTTYRSLLSWNVDTTAVELVPSVPRAFDFYFDDAAAVMANPKGHVVIDDGRRFLARTSDVYDVITLDPPPPVEASGSALLYSSQFYRLVRLRLAPGGILQQWWPGGEKRILWSVARALHAEFPYVKIYKGLGGMGFHFLASETPLPVRSVNDALKRFPATAGKDLMEWSEKPFTLRRAWELILHEPITIERLLGPDPAIVITDDKPYNEYYALRRWKARWQGNDFWVR